MKVDGNTVQQNWKGEEHVGEEVYFTHSQRFRVCLVVSVAADAFCGTGKRCTEGALLRIDGTTGPEEVWS